LTHYTRRTIHDIAEYIHFMTPPPLPLAMRQSRVVYVENMDIEQQAQE
jgi:hypothetical protein